MLFSSRSEGTTERRKMPKQTSLLEAMRELEAESAAPKERPTWAGGRLTSIPLRQLSKRTAVFQPRSLEGNLGDDEEFTRGLVKVLRDANGEALDPVTVWWSGRRFYVIDGHHRFEAYRRHHGAKAHVSIPCVEFEGTRDEAMELSGQANHKNKLPMTQDDRLNYAWRLVCTTGLTVDRIKRASGTGERVVWAMRKKLKAKIEEAKPVCETTYRCEQGGMKWRHVRDDIKEDWTDDKTLAEAKRMSARLYKEFGSLHRKAHIFALALTLHDTKLPSLLMESEAWEEHLQQIKENVEEEQFEMEDNDEDIGEEETIRN
jgi:hypothetical protein